MEVKNKFDYIDLGINLSNVVRTTLGIKGMNKMLVDASNNSAILTNDGATIIKNLKIEHPLGEVFRNLAISQETSSGDGTTTAVILAGQLLEKAKELMNKNIHRATIISGYNIARLNAMKFLEDNKIEGDKVQIIKTVFGSKISGDMANRLTTLIMESNIHNLRVFKKEDSGSNSELIKGYVFSGYTINDRMDQSTVNEVPIAIMDLKSNIEFAKFQITSADELQKIAEAEKNWRLGSRVILSYWVC